MSNETYLTRMTEELAERIMGELSYTFGSADMESELGGGYRVRTAFWNPEHARPGYQGTAASVGTVLEARQLQARLYRGEILTITEAHNMISRLGLRI